MSSKIQKISLTGRMGAKKTTMDDLPPDILVRILSFLPITTAIQTSAIAPKWRNLWLSIPILNFNIKEFSDSFPKKSTVDVYQLFAEMISHTILNRPRNFGLEKFLLTYSYFNCESPRSYLNSWIRYAIACNVKEIRIEHDGVSLFSRNDEDEDDDDDDSPEDEEANKRYCFDFTDLIWSSVTSLTLYNCQFHLPRTFAFSMKIPWLREFRLSADVPETEIKVTDEDVSNLMSVCVNLESLALGDTWGYKNLKIVSPKLKELRLGNYYGSSDFQESLEICAPSLQLLGLVSFNMGKYIMEDTSSLIEARVEFNWGEKFECFARWTNVVRLLRGVQRLTTESTWMCKFEKMQEWVHGNREEDNESVTSQRKLHGQLSIAEEVFSATFAFNNLKHLKLFTGYTKHDLLGIEALLGICPILESLVLQYSHRRHGDDNLGEEIMERRIILNMPCLRLVRMKNYRGRKSELYVVELLKENKVVLEKIVASFWHGGVKYHHVLL